MEKSYRTMIDKPLSSLPTFIDVGRLAKRINVYINEDEKYIPELDHAIVSEDSSHAYYLGAAVRKLFLHLEPQENHAKLNLAVDDFVSNAGDSLDLQDYVRELFANFDEKCRTVKIFKFINQAALSIAVTTLKVGVTTQKSVLPVEARMTKDVRTPDGWRVVVNINAERICVSHIRKEQTLGPPISPDYWDVRWRVDVSFPASMEDVSNVNIKIIQMNFGSSIPKSFKEEIERVYRFFDTGAVRGVHPFREGQVGSRGRVGCNIL